MKISNVGFAECKSSILKSSFLLQNHGERFLCLLVVTKGETPTWSGFRAGPGLTAAGGLKIRASG